MSSPTIDYRGELTLGVLKDVKTIFQTTGSVIIYPFSGTGAWEAALMNLYQPGDMILDYETGHFSTLWHNLAKSLA